MKLGQLWKNYRYYTEELTKTYRTLALSGAAVAWFFKTPEFAFPILILISLLFIVLYFGLDITHYIVGAITYKNHAENKEEEFHNRGIDFDSDTIINNPKSLDIWPQRLFWCKTVTIIIAYIFILIEIIKRIQFSF